MPNATRRPTARRHRIVAVDDDPNALALLRFSLGGDHDVAATSDASQALLALEQSKTDVLVLDLGLPRIDGVSLLAKVKQDPLRYGRPVVVVVSGSQDEDVRSRVEELGVESWFAKPYDPDLLEATVELLADALCCPPVPDDASSLDTPQRVEVWDPVTTPRG